jgi:hypothetical protein
MRVPAAAAYLQTIARLIGVVEEALHLTAYAYREGLLVPPGRIV